MVGDLNRNNEKLSEDLISIEREVLDRVTTEVPSDILVDELLDAIGRDSYDLWNVLDQISKNQEVDLSGIRGYDEEGSWVGID